MSYWERESEESNALMWDGEGQILISDSSHNASFQKQHSRPIILIMIHNENNRLLLVKCKILIPISFQTASFKKGQF